VFNFVKRVLGGVLKVGWNIQKVNDNVKPFKLKQCITQGNQSSLSKSLWIFMTPADCTLLNNLDLSSQAGLPQKSNKNSQPDLSVLLMINFASCTIKIINKKQETEMK